MPLETEVARKAFGDLYRQKLEEGIVLINHGQKSEISADQFQNVLLARMLGFTGNTYLPELFLRNEFDQAMLYRTIEEYDKVLAAQSRDFPAGVVMRIHPYNIRGIPFRKGIDFLTNGEVYTTSRELMAHRILHEYRKREGDKAVKSSKAGERGNEIIRL